LKLMQKDLLVDYIHPSYISSEIKKLKKKEDKILNSVDISKSSIERALKQYNL